MIGGRSIAKDADWRRLARLTLLLFVLRALLPTGFMPDLDLLKRGGFQIVLCTAQGPVSVAVDEDGKPLDPDGDHDRHDPADAFAKDCPFGTAFAKAFDVPTLVATAVLALPAAVATVAPRPLDLRPPPQGPPLGSRAPPIRLG